MQTGEPGILIALVIGIVIAVAAVAASALVEGRKQRRREFGRHDANASRRDGDAAATWIGIREAGHDIGPPED